MVILRSVKTEVFSEDKISIEEQSSLGKREGGARHETLLKEKSVQILSCSLSGNSNGGYHAAVVCDWARYRASGDNSRD